MAHTAYAQSNSPYSRFGVGDLLDDDNLENRGSAGLSMTQDNERRINLTNPATLASLRATTLQFGLVGARSNMATKTGSATVGSFNISNFAIGVPLGKKMAMAIGFQPYSRVNFDLAERGPNPSDTSTEMISAYNGNGGISKLTGGIAYKYKGLSVGLSAHFLFGGLNYTSYNTFLQDSITFGVRYLRGIYVRGLQPNIGVHYQVPLKQKYTLRIGAAYTPSTKLSAISDYRYVTPYAIGGGGELEDTITYGGEKRGTVILPAQLATGIALNMGYNWRVGIDYVAANWEKYRSFETADSTGAFNRIKLGWAYIPEPLATNRKYWSKVEYRMGLFTGDDYLKMRGKSIANSGFTLGMGMPLRSYGPSLGILNWAVQFGRRGTTDRGLFRDTYTRFSFGLTLTDLSWFRKRRYD